MHKENMTIPNTTDATIAETSFFNKGKRINPWLALLALSLGPVMSLLDSTTTSIALTSIQNNLHLSLSLVSWVLNAYNLTFAALLVTMGHFADLFGRKRVFQIGMILFSVGSLLCGLSSSFLWLILARIIEAIGAAGLNTISLAIINIVFPSEKRGAAIGVWGALAGVSAALGPILGGILVSQLGWRWCFFINLPVCLLALVLVERWVPETRNQQMTKNLDIVGLVVLTIALVGLVLIIIQWSTWGALIAAPLLAGAMLCLVLFFLVERAQPKPIVDIKLFALRGFLATNLAVLLYAIAVQGAIVLLILYFATVRHSVPIYIALAVLPLTLVAIVFSSIAGALNRRLGSKIEGIMGTALLCGGLWLLCTLPLNASFFDTAWREAIIGAGMGLCLTSFPKAALEPIPRSELGVGSGIFNTARQVGYTLGIAVLISVLSSFMPGYGQHTTMLISNLFQAQMLQAFKIAWLIAGFTAALGIVCACFMRSDAASGKF